METWEACEKVRNQKIAVIQAAMNLNTPENMKLLKGKITIPVTLKDFLTLRMPKRKPMARMAIYREFVRHKLREFDYVRIHAPNGVSFENVPLPDDVAVDRNIETISARGFYPLDYTQATEHFNEWFSAREALILKARASKGGKARKAKMDATTTETTIPKK